MAKHSHLKPQINLLRQMRRHIFENSVLIFFFFFFFLRLFFTRLSCTVIKLIQKLFLFLKRQGFAVKTHQLLETDIITREKQIFRRLVTPNETDSCKYCKEVDAFPRSTLSLNRLGIALTLFPFPEENLLCDTFDAIELTPEKTEKVAKSLMFTNSMGI